jgi:hypothetical protein
VGCGTERLTNGRLQQRHEVGKRARRGDALAMISRKYLFSLELVNKVLAAPHPARRQPSRKQPSACEHTPLWHRTQRYPNYAYDNRTSACYRGLSSARPLSFLFSPSAAAPQASNPTCAITFLIHPSIHPHASAQAALLHPQWTMSLATLHIPWDWWLPPWDLARRIRVADLSLGSQTTVLGFHNLKSSSLLGPHTDTAHTTLNGTRA